MRRTKRNLPDSLTQHLSDPKVVAFRPRAKRSSYRMSGSAQKIAISVVTLIVVVLAGGHLLKIW